MAKTLYPKGAEKILRASINFDTDTLKVALVSDGYTYSAAHEFLVNLGATVIGTPQTLATKVTTGGIFDADDVDFGAIATGSTIAAFVLFKDTGNAATSALLAYSTEATGFPASTNGGSVAIPWSNGPSKIIALV